MFNLEDIDSITATDCHQDGKANKELRYTPFKALGKVDQLLVKERHTLRKFAIDVPFK